MLYKYLINFYSWRTVFYEIVILGKGVGIRETILIFSFISVLFLINSGRGYDDKSTIHDQYALTIKEAGLFLLHVKIILGASQIQTLWWWCGRVGQTHFRQIRSLGEGCGVCELASCVPPSQVFYKRLGRDLYYFHILLTIRFKIVV